jgi:hypothetical protein
MSKTLIRNPSASPLPLPFPMRGVVPAGGGVVVDATVAQVRAAIGLVGFELLEVNNTPSDAFYLGNLLDPVSTQAQTTAAIAANNAVNRPGRVRLTGLDGSSNPNMVLLAAGHTPGVYDWTTAVDKQVAATGGTLTCTLNFKHPEGGVRALARGSFSLVGTGGFSVSALSFESDGTRQIDADNVFAAITGGPPTVSLAHAVCLKGA